MRELLQNARDAGARRVLFEVSTTGGTDRVVCRDDGCGMTFAHARKYLFTLYASSKGEGPRNAGRFGIGFWSVLRFSPSAITVRSRSNDHGGWQVRLDGDLNVVQYDTVEMDVGCEVVVEREAQGEEIEELVRAAVLRDAPFLTTRGHEDRPVDVRVNGKQVRADFDLPPPSLRFRRRDLRGVVGLGPEPRVEVFTHGLRVRDAASLDDLLLTGRRRPTAASAVRVGLAPQALMDCSGLTVLLARGDAREDRALRRLVAAGHREIRRLVRSELDRYAHPSWTTLVVEKLRGLWSASRIFPSAGVGLLIVLGAVVGWWMVAGRGAERAVPGGRALVDDGSSTEIGGARPYADLENRYQGPEADVLGAASRAVDLQYRPESERPFLAALLIAGIDAHGDLVFPTSGETTIAAGTPFLDNWLEVKIRVAAEGGPLRLPVATGYVIDPESVKLNGNVLALVAEVGGLPAVDVGNLPGGLLTYRSAPGVSVSPADRDRWPPLPPEVGGLSAEIAGLPPDTATAAVVEWVRRRVVYDASESTTRRHVVERLNGHGLFERSLLVGAGDCDIQNSMVAAILADAGIPSRLAVGWVGDSGRARPGLHAWVEYLGADGRWRIADASAGSGRSVPGAALRAGSPPLEAPPTWRDRKILGGLAAVMLVGVLALWLTNRSSHRHFNPGTGDGMADLVRAAVENTASFAGVHALYHRKIVPLLGGRSISMAGAIAAGSRGRLAVGRGACDVAVRAARRGTVIDRDSPVGASAAAALGAIDLDHWERVVSRSWKDPVATRVEDVLTEVGGPYRLRVASSVGEDVSVFDGARVGLSRKDRWIIFDRDGGLWRKVEEAARRRPAAAALVLADAVCDRLGLPKAVEGAWLAELARAVLAARDGGPS